ncbi:MAG TPA: glycosyltransferase, partial [Ferruginibacter sp.]|nr:glycosyltransferase [Ferruginibacter sp.]
PVDKKEAKNILDIPTNTTVISFGAVSIESYRKGWIYLNKAVLLLKEDKLFTDVILLIFGSDYNKEIAESIPFKTKFLGYLGDEYSTALAYNASDVFVVPSLADNQPTTVQESLACGTPVVGFNVGGIPDMIMHKQNGYLAKYEDENDLAIGIKYCLENKVEAKMLTGFDIETTLKKHMDLFENFKTITKVHND